MTPAALLVLLAVLPLATTHWHDVILPTGDMLPAAKLARHLAPAANISALSGRLFVLTRARFLHGVRAHPVDLHAVTSPARPIAPPPRVVLDGVLQPDPPAVRIRTGPRFALALTGAGHPLAVWADGLHLLPLDAREHPGIFVSARGGVNLTSDEDAMPTSSSPTPHAFTIEDGNLRMQTSHKQTACRSTKLLQVALAFDSEFCKRFGNSAQRAVSAIRAIFHRAETPFRPACVRLQLAHVEAHCSLARDPYARLREVSSHAVLHGFRDIWNTARRSVDRDVAFLFSGFVDRTQVAGVAYTGSACSLPYAYGWVELGNVPIFAHEVGHILNAHHAQAGLMQPIVPNNAPLSFSPATLHEINAFVASPKASCISAAAANHPPTTRPPITHPPRTTLPNLPRARSKPHPTPRQFPWKAPRTSPPPPPLPRKSPPRKSPPRKPAPRKPTPRKTGQPPRARNCAAAFTRQSTLVCRSVTAGVLRTTTGSVTVRVVQRHGRFDLVVTASRQARILSYGRRLSMNASLRAGRLPIRRVGRKGSRSFTSRWAASAVALPAGASSCCGRPLFVYLKVRLCVVRNARKSSKCSSRFGRFSVNVLCKRLCPWKWVLPMSASRPCPKCFP